MTDYTINMESSPSGGKAFIENDSKITLAEMTFSKAGETMLIIDHTEVDVSLKGQGIGRRLLDRIVEMARTEQIKILPLCPFAKSVFDKDPSIRDVLK